MLFQVFAILLSTAQGADDIQVDFRSDGLGGSAAFIPTQIDIDYDPCGGYSGDFDYHGGYSGDFDYHGGYRGDFDYHGDASTTPPTPAPMPPILTNVTTPETPQQPLATTGFDIIVPAVCILVGVVTITLVYRWFFPTKPVRHNQAAARRAARSYSAPQRPRVARPRVSSRRQPAPPRAFRYGTCLSREGRGCRGDDVKCKECRCREMEDGPYEMTYYWNKHRREYTRDPSW